MTSHIPIDPLFRFPTVRTSDPEEFRNALISVYGARDLSVPDPTELKTRGNFLQLSDIALGFSACGARAMVTFDECNFVRMQIGLRGYASTVSGRATTTVHVAQPCVTSPGRSAKLDYGPGFEHLVLRVSANTLRRKLSTMLGANPGKQIEFEPANFTSLQAVRGLQQLITFLGRQLDENCATLSPLVVRELQEAIIVGLLCACRHNFSALLEQGKDAAPAQVRRAEAYIEANHDEPVTIEKLVQITGVSARALFNAFQKSRGYSPMAFAKTVRMRRARQMLCASDATTSVTGVVLACGFSNLGHFARDYREVFGERPSETLARTRRIRSI